MSDSSSLNISRRKSEILLIGLKELLQELFKTTKIWQMVPNCNELLILSKDLSVKEVIEILSENIATFCLLIDQEKNVLSGLILVADFINFLLSLENKNKRLVEDEKSMQQYLESTPIIEFMTQHSKYSNRPFEEIIHKQDTDTLSDLIATFKNEKIGKILIKTKTLENLCVFTKKDLLVSLLQNFRPTSPDLQYLDESINEIEKDVKIMVKGSEVLFLREDQTVYEGLLMIKQQQVCLVDFLPASAQWREQVRWVSQQIAHNDHNGPSSLCLCLLKRSTKESTSFSNSWNRIIWKTGCWESTYSSNQEIN